ncbi:MAG: hypothetical protein K2G99_06585 [Desulfovibrio sp.]|nr:hypothetical protein [Desulfovibrio sp.]
MMGAKGGSVVARCLARLRAAVRDDGERCHRCGVCHNVCGLMGREPGWLHRAEARAGTAQADGHDPVDAKAQEE